TGGTTTIDGPHTFARLIVLSGAKATQVAATTTTSSELNLSVTGQVYVACAGAIDVSGKGYLGGKSGGNISVKGQSLGNLAVESRGVSHGGLAFFGSGPTYGSLFAPAESGAGGAAGFAGSGGNGGGFLSLQAGSILVDGSIAADGPF